MVLTYVQYMSFFYVTCLFTLWKRFLIFLQNFKTDLIIPIIKKIGSQIIQFYDNEKKNGFFLKHNPKLFTMASTKLINSSRLISIILCVTSLVWDQSLGLVDDKMKTVPCAPERDAAIEDQLDIPHLEKAENATSIIGETQFCENNMAGGYECSKIDLEAYLCLGDLGGPGILGGVSGAGGGANE